MALIICSECSKEISDKAAACIGCGCPIEYTINQQYISKLGKCTECGNEILDNFKLCSKCGCPVQNEFDENESEENEIDEPEELLLSKYTKNQLIDKAYSLQQKGRKKDLPKVFDIFKYIIANYSDSFEATYARKGLLLIDPEYKYDEHKPVYMYYNGKPIETYPDTTYNNSNTDLSIIVSNEKKGDKILRVIIGAICGCILGVTTSSGAFGMLLTTFVFACVGLFNLPLVFFCGLIGILVLAGTIILKVLLGI